jgi:hypothetical protein
MFIKSTYADISFTRTAKISQNRRVARVRSPQSCEPGRLMFGQQNWTENSRGVPGFRLYFLNIIIDETETILYIYTLLKRLI